MNGSHPEITASEAVLTTSWNDSKGVGWHKHHEEAKKEAQRWR
jgi:hypothetical protein